MQSVTEQPVASSGPRPSQFYAANRGGGLYSEALSQRLGALLAYVGNRVGLTPSTLTLVNLVVGVGASAVVIALAPRAAAGALPHWLLGLVALLAWQLAYAFDCADGQLARVTQRTSASGARLDILCDVAAQIGLVTALSAVAVAYRPGTPMWLLAAFAGTWMVNLVTSVMQSGPNAASMVPSRSPLVRVVKLIRDYGAVILAAGLVLTVVPQWTVVVLWAFTAVNGLFLLASIAFTARPRS
jgi:phosphatidylglycerophosphate synthase